nr:hypothetical protein [Desulfobacterales bacterium]
LHFENAIPVLQKRDTNLDGRFDVTTRYQAGSPTSEEKDSNFDGTSDLFATFDKAGQPLKMGEAPRYPGHIDRSRHYQNGIVKKMISDGDGDGFLEPRTFFKGGKITTQTQDANKDGSADVTIFFNDKGEKHRVESDTDFSGQTDAWEYHQEQTLVRTERDSNGNGKVDLKVIYLNAARQKIIRDRDHDGRFETTQWFDRPPWSMVMELDADNNGILEGRYCYKDGVLMEKTVDENGDDQFDLKEVYNDRGKIVRSEEEPDGTGRFNLTWIYDDTESAIRAEKDRDGDGQTDIWHDYRQDRLTAVTEDTNGDGKPDLWEVYDDAEALVKRSKDLNYDGKPDYEESAGGS